MEGKEYGKMPATPFVFVWTVLYYFIVKFFSAISCGTHFQAFMVDICPVTRIEKNLKYTLKVNAFLSRSESMVEC